MRKFFAKFISTCIFTLFIVITIINASITTHASNVVYQQGDARWGNIYYGNWNLAQSGCGILSTVNAVNYLTGNFIHPTEIASWAHSNNYYNGTYGQGSVRATLYSNITAAFGGTYGFRVHDLTYGNIYNSTLRNHLINGGVAIVHVPNHFMAVTAYNSSTAKFLVYDSAAAPVRNTSTLGSWLTGDQINGNSYTKVDWFCLLTRTGSAPTTPSVTLYTTNAVVESGSGTVHFGNNITTAQVAAGTVVNYQVTPAQGYVTSQILVGGTSIPIQNNGEDYVYQFTMPQGNCNVVVTFTEAVSDAASGYYNTFEFLTSSKTVHNEKVTASYIYTQGSTDVIPINGWSVNVAGTRSFYYTVDGGATATEMNQVQRLDVFSSGTLSYFANYCDSVNIGFSDSFNPSGLSVGMHTVDVFARDNTGASYQVGTITIEVKANTEVLYTTNAIVSGGSGAVHFGNNITTAQVISGTVVNYQVTPAQGYLTSEILVGGVAVDIQNNGEDFVYQFNMPANNCDVVVTFAKIPVDSDYYNTFDMTTPSISAHNDKVVASFIYTKNYDEPIDINGWSLSTAGTKSFYYTVDGGTTKTEIAQARRDDVLAAFPSFTDYCDSANIGFSDTFDPEDLSVGMHTVDIYARNNSGASYQVGTITIKVENDDIVSSVYGQQLINAGFPKSYLPMLMELHDQHPNWKFQPLNVTQINNSGYTWDYVVTKMLEDPARNLMIKSTWAPAPFAALGDANYSPYRDESYGTFDSGSWYAITPEATRYFIDPRNFLNEIECFMFLDWNYSDSYITEAQVETVLAGSVFANTVIPDLDGSTTYAEYILSVCTEIGVNPLFTASRLVQENGAGSPMVQGTVGDVLGNAELNGLFNFFNMGAYGNGLEEIYANGMKEAQTGTPSMAEEWGSAVWNTRWKAIYGGILKLRDNYINVYKNTLYMQKFNTDPRGIYNFSGYMQNVCAPIFESRNMQESLKEFGLLDNEFTFSVPVYDNMPVELSADPGNGITRCSYAVVPVTDFSIEYVNTYDENGGYAPQVKTPISVEYNLEYGSTTPIIMQGWSLHEFGVNGYFYTLDGSDIRTPLDFQTRSDVLAVYPDYAADCSAEKIGYTGSFNPQNLTNGSHELCVYGVTDDGDIYETAILTINIEMTSVHVDGSVTGSDTNYSYTFDMAAPEKIKGTFIVALYDADNRLVGIATQTMDIASDTYTMPATDIHTSAKAQTYKIMFLSGFDTLKPLCNLAAGTIISVSDGDTFMDAGDLF